MKLHLLLLVCLVASSWQQNSHYSVNQLLYSPYRYYSPQYFYHQQTFQGSGLNQPLYPYSPAFVEELFHQRNLALHLLEANGIIEKSNDANDNEDHNQQDEGVEGRFMSKGNKAESRGAALLLPALLFGSALYGSTSTKYSFVTSTLTSTSTVNCIASASFTPGSSTVTCRKRRDLALVRDLLANADDQLLGDVNAELAPTATLSVEPTAEPARIPQSDINDRISSSLNEKHHHNRNRRAFGFGAARLYNTIFANTVTSTVTTYSFVTTNTKKTISIGSSLLCIPSGYNVC